MIIFDFFVNKELPFCLFRLVPCFAPHCTNDTTYTKHITLSTTQHTAQTTLHHTTLTTPSTHHSTYHIILHLTHYTTPRIVYDTTQNWKPRRLGGGLGGTRIGRKDQNSRNSGRSSIHLLFYYYLYQSIELYLINLHKIPCVAIYY